MSALKQQLATASVRQTSETFTASRFELSKFLQNDEIGKEVYLANSGFAIFPFKKEAHQQPANGIFETLGQAVVYESGLSLLDKQEGELPKEFEVQSDSFGAKIADIQSDATFITLKKWEGIVQKIDGDKIFAKIISLPKVHSAYEEIEFLKDEISSSDFELVSEGAVFYWFVGYHETTFGQRTRGSIFRFRRMPAWSSKDIEDAKKVGSGFFKLFSKK